MATSIMKDTTADVFAEVVSYVFHPLIVVIPTLVIATIQTGYTLGQALFWTILPILIVNVPMALLLLYGVRSGRYTDASVSVREQRTSVYAVGGICLVITLLVLIFGSGPPIVTACIISAVLATILGYLVNRYTKLSLHSAAMAGCTTVLLWTTPLVGVILAICAPLVGWARIRLKHHTPIQIVLGWCLAAAPVIIVFRLMLL